MIINRALRLTFIMLIFGLSMPSVASARELVVVSSNATDYSPISRFELRKLFLGYPVKQNGKVISAIRNTSDDRAYSIFLQKLIRLSAKNYERRLMAKTFKTGAANVPIADSFNMLIDDLIETDSALSFMWMDEVEAQPGVKFIESIGDDTVN
ncbi:hypothetical protein A9Q79_04905 [Methylophaga sp. 42_25_T18]|nr:hypothetical protein A9Q79_04905 [Methylophaga sp. 42_25_T18]OUR85746.1 hypothetical protein A9Q92_07550 [Methylophaga sp. 42_8_T64]